MAREKTRRDSSVENSGNPLGHFDDEELVKDLIGSINKEAGNLIAYNLSTDQSPTHVKRWISTGCVQLDYAISGRRDGGLPEGRIIEIYGPPSIGKSHLGVQIAKSAQKMGGIAVYIDTENATNPENLAALGLDVSKRFVYTNPGCVEDVFSVVESTILKTRSMAKDVPVVVIWDSLAATPAKAELEGDYDKELMGVQARALGKGFRKVTQVIGNSRATLVVMNQTRQKLGVMFGDPTTTPGGNALPFFASVRIQLNGGGTLGEKDAPYGIVVNSLIKKNRITKPFRRCSFEIHFGKGIFEGEELFDRLRDNGPEVIGTKRIAFEGTNAWKTFSVRDVETDKIQIEEKFYKPDFNRIWKNPEFKPFVDDIIDRVLTKDAATPTIDPETGEVS